MGLCGAKENLVTVPFLAWGSTAGHPEQHKREEVGMVVTHLSQDKAKSEEEDDREDGQDAGYGHPKHHRQLLLLGWREDTRSYV